MALASDIEKGVAEAAKARMLTGKANPPATGPEGREGPEGPEVAKARMTSALPVPATGPEPGEGANPERAVSA